MDDTNDTQASEDSGETKLNEDILAIIEIMRRIGIPTRRDLIAGLALQGMLGSPWLRELNTPNEEKAVAMRARRIADFLLEELDANPR